MKHKVVFCFHTNDHEYNMGIGFISAFLKQGGTDVDIVVYREIKGRDPDTPEDIAKQIIEKMPTVAAFSVMTFNWHRIRRVISLLRPEFDGLIVVGGYHAILAPEEVLAFPGVDVVCTGEGELPLRELVEHTVMRGGKNPPAIKGMLFRDAPAGPLREPWLIENLSEYPYMDYDLFDAEGTAGLSEKYMGMLSAAGIFSLPVITGRGCPYHCTYCSNSALIDRYGGVKRFLRKYDPPSAIDHIKGAVRKYKPSFLELLDETFTLSRKWVTEFCSLYRSEIGLPFSIMSRIDTVDDRTVSILAESGFKLVFFGIESGDEAYRTHYLKRMMSDRTIKEGARLLKRYGISIVTFNIFGMPFETKETIRKTYELNEEIEPDAAIPFIYQLFPGTDLARLAYEHHMAPPPPEDRWDYCTPSLDTSELPAAYVVEAVEEFRKRFGNQQRVQDLYKRLQDIAGLVSKSAE
jgi:radical SAM superfamily enzyme YgiQ (UPF0313 family)